MVKIREPLPLPALDRRGAEPLYRQLHGRIRDAILAGALPAGSRLPSSRSLAAQLPTARSTVEAAYVLLAAEGWIEGRGAAGTLVAQRLPAPRRHGGDVSPPASGGDHPAPLLRPLHPGLPAFDAFPRKTWARLVARAARRLGPESMGYNDPAGHPALRAALARHLRLARGIAVEPEEIVVTTGFQGALSLVARALLPPGAGAWVEEPGYFRAREGLRAAGLRSHPVPVDDEGLDVAAGRAAAPAARLALVAPSHQLPLGGHLALSRRLALLAWAGEAGAWVLEDDYGGEFRYGGRSLPALKTLDREGRVLHVGSFSKTLYPALGLGYLVPPPDALPAIRRAAWALGAVPSFLAQVATAEFLAEGHLARHVRRLRRLYAERRAALAKALATVFPAWPRAIEGGLHILQPLPADLDEASLAVRAAAAGFGLEPLSLFYSGAAPRGGLVLGFCNLPAEEAEHTVTRLAAALHAEEEKEARRPDGRRARGVRGGSPR